MFSHSPHTCSHTLLTHVLTHISRRNSDFQTPLKLVRKLQSLSARDPPPSASASSSSAARDPQALEAMASLLLAAGQ